MTTKWWKEKCTTTLTADSTQHQSANQHPIHCLTARQVIRLWASVLHTWTKPLVLHAWTRPSVHLNRNLSPARLNQTLSTPEPDPQSQELGSCEGVITWSQHLPATSLLLREASEANTCDTFMILSCCSRAASSSVKSSSADGWMFWTLLKGHRCCLWTVCVSLDQNTIRQLG